MIRLLEKESLKTTMNITGIFKKYQSALSLNVKRGEIYLSLRKNAINVKIIQLNLRVRPPFTLVDHFWRVNISCFKF